ncbi:hypothetical protein [Rhizobium sp. CF142]|uniref:hypothetical protein n=1 Tax=Rhizobium sp. CF142 TaxID=1144314 RepID=UPI00026EF004|nr:hypothetical protein [Rhizobium sp. CF142]EJJ25474.1 hypothetical protein PMI11_06349 [Rhizobium sp. CF142]
MNNLISRWLQCRIRRRCSGSIYEKTARGASETGGANCVEDDHLRLVAVLVNEIYIEEKMMGTER